MKRIVSLLLTVVIVIGIITSVPLTALAASESDLTFKLNVGGKSYSVTSCNTNTEGSLVIPDTYNGLPVTTIGKDAFKNCINLTSITIGASVKSINGSAFTNCKSVTSFVVEGNNDSFSSLNGVLFNKDKTLLFCYPKGKTDSSYVIPSSVTSIGDYAFSICSSLTSVTIPDNVSRIGEDAFYSCTNLTSVYITDIVAWCDIDFVNDYSEYGELYYSNPLRNRAKLYLNGNIVSNLVVPDSVRKIKNGVFAGYSSLISVIIPDSVTSIGNSSFSGCSNLTTITIGNNVTSIDSYAFRSSALTSITIPGSVTSVGERAFYGCDKLIKGIIGNSVTSIGDEAFAFCDKLTSITIGNSVTSIGYDAFLWCFKLNAVYITDISSWCNIGFSISRFGDFSYESNPLYHAKNLYLDNELVTTLVIPNGVTRINSCAFVNCINLTSVLIPSSVTNIGSYAFQGCTNLVSVYTTDLSKWCAINFANELSNPLNYARALYVNGEIVTAAIIPDNVTSIGKYAFYSYGLTSITIPDSVISIGTSAFSWCTGLTLVTIPDSVTKIGDESFYCCKSLTSIIIPNSVTSIGTRAFFKCDNLTIYGVSGSYAETYAKNNNIPFKDISEFGSVSYHTMLEGGVLFQLYNKDVLLELETSGLTSDLKARSAINNASVEYNNMCKSLSTNTHHIVYSNLAQEITFTAPDFYNYVIPAAVAKSFKENSVLEASVYMTKDRKDGKPYISTVFGRQHDDDCENEYKELQSSSVNILKDATYDVIVTADLKDEASAKYYLSQDEYHKTKASTTGVFSAVELYSIFDINKPVYAYAVTSSGKVTEPVAIKMSKMVCGDALNTLLSSPKINLLGSDAAKLTISDNIPIIGGAQVSMDFVEIPIGVEIEGERVRISLGRDFFKYSTQNGKQKEKDWISFKETCKEIEDEMKTGEDVSDKCDALEKAQKQRGYDAKYKRTKKTTGLDFDASYLGYIEGYIIDQNVVFTEFSGSIAAEVIAKYTVNGFVGPVPAYFYIQGGAEGALSLELAKTIPDKNILFEFNALLNVTPKGKIGGGVGTKGVASAGLYGSFEAPASYGFNDKHFTLSLKAKVGAEGEFLIFKGGVDLISGSWNVINKYFGNQNGKLGGFSQVIYNEMTSNSNTVTTDNGYTLASRDYAATTSGWLPLNVPRISNRATTAYSAVNSSNVTITDLQTSVYKNSQTQLVKFGDKLMLAYIEDCAGRDTYNRYRLMYTVYNPATNTWTQPKAVCDTGKMDASPSLATDGENVYIAWQTVNSKVAAATESALYAAMNNMEIYSAKYDKASDKFVNVTRHTNNSKYDYAPFVTVDNGKATVYWVNAESTDFIAGKMSIHSSANSKNTLIYDKLNYVVSLKAAGSEVSYAMDIDGDVTTADDIKLFTNGKQIGEDVVDAAAIVTNFDYGIFNGAKTLFYTDGEAVYYVKNGSSVEAFYAKNGVSDSIEITELNGNPAVIYTQLTDMGSELCISTLENGVWSEPVYLTDLGCSISNTDVASINGRIYTVFNRTKTTTTTDSETGLTYPQYGQTDLCMITSNGYYDLEISNIGYNEGDAIVGSSAPVIVVMENKGTERINSVEFTVSDSRGYSRTITKDVNLASGAIESVELAYTAQSGYTKADLTVTAKIKNKTDVDTSNNTTTTQIGRTDISVGEISVERIGDIFEINCEVKNDSLVNAENVSVNISFGASSKKVNIGTMSANSANMVELFVSKDELVFDENDVCTLTYSASTSSEELALGNNENTVTIGNTQKLEEHKHNFVNDVCDGCGMNAFSYDVSSNGATITRYNGTATEVVIPSVIGGLPVTAIGTDAFRDCTEITSVNIPESVISIGGSAFRGCTKLKELVLPKNITSLPGAMCFGCTKLESVTIPIGVTSIGGYAFGGCTGLTDVYYDGSAEDWKKISIGSNNDGLTNAEIHYAIVSSIIDSGTCGNNVTWTLDKDGTFTISGTGDMTNYGWLGSPFCKSTEIKNIIVNEGITSIGDWAFTLCNNLTSVILPDSVTSIGNHAFAECEKLASVTIPDKVTSIGDNAFQFCSSLKSINIPNGVTSLSNGIFQYCTSLTSVSIPDTLKRIGNSAFDDCTNLASITIPDTVTYMGVFAFTDTAYYNNPSNWENGVLYIGKHLIGAKETVSGVYSIKDGTKTIGGYAFDDCVNLTGVIIPDSVVFIGYSVFSGTALNTVYYCGTEDQWDAIYIGTGNNVIDYIVYNYSAKPATPKVATENALTGVLVKWNAVGGAVKYNVYRRTGGSSSWIYVGTTTGTSLTDTKVTSGIYYVYSVRAYNSAGQYSDFVSANTNTRKYMAVPKLKGISNATNGLYITWNPVAGITKGYRVYRRGAGSTYWTYLGTTKNTYYTDTAVKNKSGEYFRYTVIADGDYHSKFDTTGLYLRRLSNPTLTSAVSLKTGITVKWTPVKGCLGYYVYRKTANSGWVRVGVVNGVNSSSFVDKTAQKGVTYTYTVRAVCGATTSAYNSGISCYDKY